MSAYEKCCDNLLHRKIGAANAYIVKIVLCIIIAVIVGQASYAMDIKFRLFFERDADLSYYPSNHIPNFDSVTVGAVIGMSVGIGLAFCVISTAMVVISPSTGRTKDTGLSRFQHFLIYALALIFSLLAQSAATDIIKVSDARPRPSVFYICNYQGYREAVDSGNFTSYNSLTTVGAAGNIKCVLIFIHTYITYAHIYMYN